MFHINPSCNVIDIRRSLGASALSIGLTAARVGSALAVNKIIAILLGPGGLALVGQFQNFTAIAFGVTSGNVTNAVVSTVAASGNAKDRRRAIGTSIAATFIGTLVVALAIAYWSTPLATVILGTPDLAPAMLVFSVAMLPAILHVVVLGILLGIGASTTFAIVQVALAIASIPACWLLVATIGIQGALLSATIVSAGMILLTFFCISRKKLFPLRWLISGIHRIQLQRLAKLTGMSLSTLLAIPAAQLLVRQEVFASSGGEGAGHWQAALKMGEVLLMLTSATIALHFLPLFSSRPHETSSHIARATGTLLLLLSPVAILVVIGSPWVVPLLFSSEFSGAIALLPLQFLGDILRSVMSVMQAAFMAQSKGKSYVSVDMIYAVSLVVGAHLFVPQFGPIGGSWAAAVSGMLGLLLATAFTYMPRIARKAAE